MRVLLIHPEDSPRTGPWSSERWDLLVDLGKSSPYSEAAWAQQYGCRVLRSDSFRHGVADARLVRQIFSAGRGQLLDELGIDWWDLTSLLIVPEALTVLALRRVAAEIDKSCEIWATRLAWPVSALAILHGGAPRSFETTGMGRAFAGATRYAGLLRRFSAAQIREIFLDKYDSSYLWRSRFSSQPKRCATSVSLVPSAYGNVSRMASAYASLLPRESFLMVATRQSAKRLAPPPNFQVRDLAGYARGSFPASEVEDIQQRWTKLRSQLESNPELQVLSRAKILDRFPQWLHDGLGARNAWSEVLDHEPVSGVLCGDDSNLFTRLPVLLAARRKLPTADFHHGAFDGRYLFKDLPCAVYFAKNEMEQDYLIRVCGLDRDRVVIAAPPSEHASLADDRDSVRQRSIVFFSEPYEGPGMRAEEVYREVLPPLCHLARTNGVALTVKLHPFESLSERSILVRKIVGTEDASLISCVAGPLTSELMARTWFGVTVESTTVLDCAKSGIHCFLCGWLSLSSYEYTKQYIRFGIGQFLENAKQIGEIPERLNELKNQPLPAAAFQKTVDPEMLQSWLTCGSGAASEVRPAS